LDKIFTMDREKAMWTEVVRGKEEKKASKPDRIHKITSVIAKYLIEREGADGIVWRSAQAQGARAVVEERNEAKYLLNLAICPEFVDEHMKLKKVYKIRINTWVDETGQNRATREALEIGALVGKDMLEFSELSDSEKDEFEAIHNICGVPLKLAGKVHLMIEGLTDIEGVKSACYGMICGAHDDKFSVKVDEVSSVQTTVITCCCDEYSNELIRTLRDVGIWH